MTATQVAQWLGVVLLGAFIIAFCYYTKLGFVYLQHQIFIDKTVPCTCTHRYDSHYPTLNSCTVSRCTCQRYVPGKGGPIPIDEEYRR